MSITGASTDAGRTVGTVPALAMIVGVLVVGYGLLLVPLSVLGGVWIAAVGVSLALAGVVASDRIGARLGLGASTRRTLSWACVVFSAILLVAFLLVNGATFGTGSARGRG